jgi:hypothetical protein
LKMTNYKSAYACKLKTIFKTIQVHTSSRIKVQVFKAGRKPKID